MMKQARGYATRDSSRSFGNSPSRAGSTKTLNKREAVPGAVISIQTFGDLVNFHPHLHCLVTDGCFMPNGWLYVLPEIDVKKLESLFRPPLLQGTSLMPNGSLM